MNGYPLFWSMPHAAVRKQLSGRSAFFHKMEQALFVAESEGQPVARCAAMINRAWQASQGADTTGSTNSVKAAIPAVGVNDTSGAPTRTHRAPRRRRPRTLRTR